MVFFVSTRATSSVVEFFYTFICANSSSATAATSAEQLSVKGCCAGVAALADSGLREHAMNAARCIEQP